jgi:predicted porin
LEYFEMKKSLIALAALAVVGAASAQSTVTLYGVADAWFGQTTTRGNDGVSLTQTVLNSGGANGSRWGLKGSEDLGGGLKANFQLESGFGIDTGAATDGLAFSRQAFVGVSGAFGALTLGRQYSAYDSLRAATNNSYDTALATTGAVFGNGLADYTSRVNNSIAFTSANYSGFSGAAVVGLGENKTAAADAGKNVSLTAQYAAGPLLAGYAYQGETTQNATVTGTDSISYNLFAASYDFGMAKLTGGYNIASQDKGGINSKDKEFQLGVNAPVGAAANVAFGYSKSTAETADVATSNARGYTLMGIYDLSKRTRLYAGWNKSTKNVDATAIQTESSVMAAGIRHAF